MTFGLPVLVSSETLAMRDSAHFYRPLFEWCAGEWAAGRVPLWNPYENCGVPVLADASSSVFYPGKLLFLLPVDFAFRYELYVLGHVALAGLFSYLLARRWQASQCGAALAAVAYACGGGVLFQYCNVVFLIGAAWLPLAAMAIDQMLTARSWRAAALLGAVLALMTLGGDPQSAYHTLLAAALLALLAALRRQPAEGQHEKVDWRNLARQVAASGGLIALAAVVGGGLAAIQIVPSAEATAYSERAAFNRPRNIFEAAKVAAQAPPSPQPFQETKTTSVVRGLFGRPEPGSHYDLAFDFSIGPWRLAEYVWPNVGGRMFPTHRRWFSLLPAEGRAWTPSLYMGLLPAVLGLASLRLRSANLRQCWLSWLCLLGTVATFGSYGIGWAIQEAHYLVRGSGAPAPAIGDAVGGLYWLMVTLLPSYVYFRYPAKLLPLVALALSQLGAMSLDRYTQEASPRLIAWLKRLAAGSGAAGFLVWCLGPRLFSSLGRADGSLGPFDMAGAHADVLFAFVQTALVAAAAIYLFRRCHEEVPRRAGWQALLVVLTAAEIVVANRWLIVTAPAEIWRSESPLASRIKSASGQDEPNKPPLTPRVFRANLATWRPPSFRKAASAQRGSEIAAWEQGTLFPKYPLNAGLSLVESYGSIKLLDYESLVFIAKRHGPAQADKTALPQPGALRLLGTEFLVLPASHEPTFAYELPQEADAGRPWPESARLWRMKRTLPRAWVVQSAEALPPLPQPRRIFDADERAKEVLFPGGKARDFRNSAVVEALPAESDGLAALAKEPGEAAAAEPEDTCQILHYDPQRITLGAQLSSPGLLVVSEAWFPGWHATVTTDGETRAVPIHRTNRVFRGISLPAGTHTVEFRFRPASFYRGAAISGAALGLWALSLLLGAVLRRRRRSDD